ncbi:MAG: hypothetical protein ACI3XR_10425 [Eubacteriales bacterium]
MSDNRKRPLRWAYDLLFLLLTLALGALFIFQTASIYREGTEARVQAAEAAEQEAIRQGLNESQTRLAVSKAKAGIQIYSREIVAEKFAFVLPVLILWLAVTLFGMVYSLICPTVPEKRRKTPAYMTRDRLSKRLPNAPANQKDAENLAEFSATQSEHRGLLKQSKLLLGIASGICLILALFPFCYLLDFSHFPNTDLNGEVVKMALFSLPFVGGMLLAAIVYVILRDRQIQKIIDIEKHLTLIGDKSSVAVSKPANSRKWIFVLRIALVCVGVGLVLFGCFNESVRDVFVKATNICTECIGLG